MISSLTSEVIRLPEPEVCKYEDQAGFAVVYAVDTLSTIPDGDSNPVHTAAIAYVDTVHMRFNRTESRRLEARVLGSRIINTTVEAVVGGETLFSREINPKSFLYQRRLEKSQAEAKAKLERALKEQRCATMTTKRFNQWLTEVGSS